MKTILTIILFVALPHPRIAANSPEENLADCPSPVLPLCGCVVAALRSFAESKLFPPS